MVPYADVPTWVELVNRAVELGRTGAIAAAEHWSPMWLATMFGARARDEVFATQDVRVCGTLAPGATATPAGDGVVVDGSWEVSDAAQAHWQVAIIDPLPKVALLLMADLRATATGTEASGLFVPAHRVLSLSTVAFGWVAAAWATPRAGIIVGMALDALDSYFEGLTTDHGPTFAGDISGFQPLLAHVQTADALAMLTEAEGHAHRLATLVDTGADWADEDTTRARTDLTAVCRLTGDAVYLLATIGGPAAAPIRRIARDLGAATHRASTDFDAALPDGQQGRAVA